MLTDIRRLDYPAHCHDIKKMGSFITAPLGTSLQKDSCRVLIVANSFDTSAEFEPAIHLSRLLSDQSVAVDLVLTKPNKNDSTQWERVKSEYSLEKSNFISLPRNDRVLKGPTADVLETSFHFHQWLTLHEHEYTTVISLDVTCDMYYALTARENGMAYSAISFLVFSTSSSYFDHVKSVSPVMSNFQLNVFYAERKVFEYADNVISNSQHFLNWLIENECPGCGTECYFQEMASSIILDANNQVSPRECHKVVFLFDQFSLTELTLCLEAARKISSKEVSYDFIFPRDVSKVLRDKVKLLTRGLGQSFAIIREDVDAIDWPRLVNEALVFVIPNAENFNSTILSSLRNSGVPVLTSSTTESESELFPGGRLLTFVHNPHKIRAYIDSVIKRRVVAEKFDRNASEIAWLGLITQGTQRFPQAISTKDKKSSRDLKVSVCISHFNRGEWLVRAIKSIQNQTYPCVEIIVVDDGSTDAETLTVLDNLDQIASDLTIKLLRQENLYIGASRNTGLSEVSGEYVLFMDDDNEAMPNELEVFIACAQNTGADILTCFSEVFSGETPEFSVIERQQALFVGPNTSASLSSNPFGDSNMFARTASVRSIQGFSEYYRVGRDDQEFFVRAKMNGLTISLVPKALYYYRLSNNRIRHGHINQYAGLARVLHSRISQVSVSDAQQLAYMQGLAYASGPFGPNLRFAILRSKLRELARIYIAKYTWLYSFVGWVRKRLS
ncbi:MAG: glycosyltransferase involved in cell wall biosynthesis [Candidatus Azotimanducaceae bacterium]|jgi:glycosyltransferase involved in cell wall biosynthesis